MSSNGYIPRSQLSPIPGSGPYGKPRLLHAAAHAYNAMHSESMRRFGISMALNEGSVGRAYRSFPRQVLAKRIYGSNAATPGTSNHGLGINVDLENTRQRWVVDKIGAKYGFAKRCSDASWEWWHITYRPACSGATYRYSKYPTLRRGDVHPAVYRLQRMLRNKNVKGAPKPNGVFGPATQKAVNRYKRKHRLPADGIVGAKTWRSLRR